MTAAPRPVLQPIGRSKKPIRALAFAGGGFDTAMQLGVTHALLVSRGRAPDVVIGCSAGAVNAVALAEVLQAGDLTRRVARFREIYDEYLKAPGTMFGATRPDTFQVDTQRPLEPLKLPIHHLLERDSRLAAVASRAGIINLYNTLLNIRVSIGTMTKAVRRWLGVQAAGNIQQPALRTLIVIGEWLRTWMLFGANVSKLSPLARVVIDGSVHTQPEADHGATAGALIFQSRLWAAVERLAGEWFGLLLLSALWVLVSAVGPVIVGAGPVLLWEAIPGGPAVGLGGWTVPAAALVGTALLSLLVGVVGEPPPEGSLGSWWNAAAYGVGVVGRTLPRALWATVIYVLLMLRWSLVVGIAVAAPFLADLALSPGRRLLWVTYRTEWLPWAIAVGIVMLAAVAAGWTVVKRRKTLGIGLLRLFDLDRSLLDPEPLRRLLINLFHKSYYGDVLIDRVVESALRNNNDPIDGPREEKYLEDYAAATQTPPIHVLVTVADVATADFDFLPGTYRVIDGLVAATAAPPLFPPVSHGRRLFVDGAVVANDPARPLFRFLRRALNATPPLVNPDSAVLHLYSVSPLPFNAAVLGREPNEERPGEPLEYTNLVDVVRRALALQRFRDARLERTLSELHTKAMPQAGTVFYPPPTTAPAPAAADKTFVRTWVYPIEPERPLNANAALLAAETESRRREVIAETVADGCRAALSVMVRDAVEAMADPAPVGGGGNRVALCRLAVEEHRKQQLPNGKIESLPGSAPQIGDNGPGLTEVCAHCALFRHREARRPGRPGAAAATPGSSAAGGPEPERARSLLWQSSAGKVPPWPGDQADAMEPDWEDPPHVHSVEYPDQREAWGRTWPHIRAGGAAAGGSTPPTVSFLFSGGVFRGVFQVGVLNGLSEAGLVPDVVAGASVGAITGAMVASAFFGDPTRAAADPLTGRRAAIRRLAAAYLAIDRLVLTDRFADFIRGLTIRGAQARFSIRQADRVIRRFDDANPWGWSRDLRCVVAGVERLTYVSPFELVELLEAFRRQQTGRIAELLREDVQELLDRATVGAEVLGAEPLTLLVQEYVLNALGGRGAAKATFQSFLDRGLVFLATTTNLTDGLLDTLGAEQLFDVGGSGVMLESSRRASSAFPAVFRPRWEWEMRPASALRRQYIDGGVMDNLPLDAVAQFLSTAAQLRLIEARPPAPHLIFSASLETETPPITDDARLDELRGNWPRLFGRARRLGYNTKLQLFERTQRNVRAIMAARAATGTPPAGQYTPLDLWVTTVIPKWLCGTFAFHPMLGFRQWKQAASIAHGCASTLLALGLEAARPQVGAGHAAAWGMDPTLLPAAAQCTATDPFVPLSSPATPGNCWYRPAAPCPFSAQGQQGVTRRTGHALTEIYRRCGQIKTHRPQ